MKLGCSAIIATSIDQGLQGKLWCTGALRNWIRAAEFIRSTCRNLPAFEALIRHHQDRLARLMQEDIRSLIRSNIASLFDAAELLGSKEYYGPAIHLMMAAREEAVKWLSVHCWVHLDQDSRAKIFSHEFKHKTAGIFYFLSGQLQAIDFAIGLLELLKEEEPQASEATAALIERLPEALHDDPESIAEIIVSSLHYAGHPNVILATYHIDKLFGLNPSKDPLHPLFPEWKNELEKNLKEAASRIKAAKQMGELPASDGAKK